MDVIALDYQLRRVYKGFLTGIAKFLIIISFLADAYRCSCDWYLEKVLLNFTWKCGHLLAGIFICLIVMGQIVASLMLLANIKIHIASIVLTLVLHLRMLTYPEFISIEVYMDICCVITAIIMKEFKLCRQSFMGFLFMTYSMWQLDEMDSLLWCVHKYMTAMLIIFALLGIRAKTMMVFIAMSIAIRSWTFFAWWDLPYSDKTMHNRLFMHFCFWNRISMFGGLLMAGLQDFVLKRIY